jgi:hypothetical protein
MNPANFIEAVAEEIRRNVPRETLPEEPSDDLFLIYAVLLLAKGHMVEARDVHNAWSAWMTEREPGHESIRPFDELPSDVRQEDDPYLLAIRSAARSLRPR